MIQATEKLMEGNYVYYDGGSEMEQICKLDATDIFNISTDYMYNRQIHTPIPLTPEILLKAGFEKMPLSSVQRYRSTETLFFIQLHKKEWFIYGYKYYPNGIKYLHELQNLFYILVGRELTLTL